MSTPALALPIHRVPRRLRRRRHALNRFPLQWHDVPVAESAAFTGPRKAVPRRWLIALVAVAVLAAHGLGVWYGNRVSLGADVKPKKSTLAIELVRPPKPLPKVEPPPPPPKRTPPRAPPPIHTAAIVPSEAPVAAPVEAVAAVAPAEPAPPPAPEPVKPAFGGIGYKNNPPPDYPTLAARQGWQGTVLLRVRVLTTGAVESVEVVKSSGKKVLDDAAIHTVERWVFAPSTRGNAPIDGYATVPIEFKLDS
ncbi:MAG TPA: energy transducer TonB [Steroidobacteraceae bacterium]|jgi:protein TonB|nr:energy transducer TonB [Steroidobacteraceae bacterium]